MEYLREKNIATILGFFHREPKQLNQPNLPWESVAWGSSPPAPFPSAAGMAAGALPQLISRRAGRRLAGPCKSRFGGEDPVAVSFAVCPVHRAREPPVRGSSQERLCIPLRSSGSRAAPLPGGLHTGAPSPGRKRRVSLPVLLPIPTAFTALQRRIFFPLAPGQPGRSTDLPPDTPRPSAQPRSHGKGPLGSAGSSRAGV